MRVFPPDFVAISQKEPDAEETLRAFLDGSVRARVVSPLSHQDAPRAPLHVRDAAVHARVHPTRNIAPALNNSPRVAPTTSPRQPPPPIC